jgi:hypothetical protein
MRKRREFNLETHFLFLDYEKAFDQVNRPTLFNILHKKNIADPLLSALDKIYEHNEIKIKLDNKMTQSVEINRGVHQGCPLSPTLFNTYINKILPEWNTNNIGGIQLTRNKEIKTLVFADDQVITAEYETLLQKSIHTLESITSKRGLTISTSKTKTMAFRGTQPIRSKVIINNIIAEQINTYNYLGYSLPHKKQKDVPNKLSKFLQSTGIVNQTPEPSNTQKQTRLQPNNTITVPTLLCGREAWILMEQDRLRITAAEMKVVRKTAKYILFDHKRNQDMK